MVSVASFFLMVSCHDVQMSSSFCTVLCCACLDGVCGNTVVLLMLITQYLLVYITLRPGLDYLMDTDTNSCGL